MKHQPPLNPFQFNFLLSAVILATAKKRASQKDLKAARQLKTEMDGAVERPQTNSWVSPRVARTLQALLGKIAKGGRLTQMEIKRFCENSVRVSSGSMEDGEASKIWLSFSR